MARGAVAPAQWRSGWGLGGDLCAGVDGHAYTRLIMIDELIAQIEARFGELEQELGDLRSRAVHGREPGVQ